MATDMNQEDSGKDSRRFCVSAGWIADRARGVTSMYGNRSQYLLAIVASLAMGAPGQSASANNPLPGVPGAPLSSSFPGPFWEVVAPRGGAATVSNQHLFLKLPGGSNHDALAPSNQALRVVQPIGNLDFDVSIRIDSPILAKDESTGRGLMVLSDNQNYITFALMTDGTHLGLSIHTVSNGVPATVFEEVNFDDYQDPMYLRLARTGVDYKAHYSIDGVVWIQAASFTDTKVPALIGPFASNFNPTPTRAVPVVMAIHWFNIM
jgi:hypothetical protein